jgi:hypothetical protein
MRNRLDLTRVVIATTTVLVCAAPGGVRAQSLRTTLALSAGTGTDQRGIRSNAQTLAPGLTLQRGPDLTLGIGGAYTRYATGVSSVGAALGGSVQRHIAHPLVIAVTANGSYATTSFDQSFAAAAIASLAEWRVGPLAIYAGPRLQYGRTTFTRDHPGKDWLPGPLGGAAPTRTQHSASSVHAFGLLAGTQLTLTNAARTRAAFLGYRTEHATFGGLPVTDHTLSTTLAAAQGRVSLSAGRRVAEAENRPFTSATVAWFAHPAFTVELSGGSYLSNRVSGALSGSYLQAGVSWSPGASRSISKRSANVRAQHVPRGVAPPVRGVTRLAIRAPSATRVTIAGDWNQWKEVATVRADNGVWYVDVPLAPGEYRYAFRADGEWRVPDGSATIDDGFGGKSALVIVSGQPLKVH